MPTAAELLRELRPTEDALPHDPAEPTAVALLERILDDRPPVPAARAPRRRPARRRVLAGGLAALAIAGGVVLIPFGGDSPGVLARAAGALNRGDAILHVKLIRRGAGAGGVDATEESWQTTDGRHVHTLYDGGRDELYEDWDIRTNLTYSAAGDHVVRHTDPRLFPASGPKGVAKPSGLGYDALGDLQRLFAKAQHGEGSVRLLADTAIGGHPVHAIEITYPMTKILLPPVAAASAPSRRRTVTFTRLVYVDTRDFLPVRVVERMPGSADEITDFTAAERLPRTPENDAKLRFDAHPGARRTDRADDFSA